MKPLLLLSAGVVIGVAAQIYFSRDDEVRDGFDLVEEPTELPEDRHPLGTDLLEQAGWLAPDIRSYKPKGHESRTWADLAKNPPPGTLLYELQHQYVPNDTSEINRRPPGPVLGAPGEIDPGIGY
jgi:hypothetical protein